MNLKAFYNSPIQTLDVIQIDVDVWGQTVEKKGVVVVQEAMDSQVPIKLGMNVLRVRQMAQEVGPLYRKELPGVRPAQTALRRTLQQCRIPLMSYKG